jgi:hypothetical protein
VRTKLIGVYGLLVAAALATALGRPVAFQKANSIVPVQAVEPLRSDKSLDVATRLATIPYRSGGDGQVWTVEPRARYRETILAGRGNCSNLAFGFAYELRGRGLDYQVIHLFPEDFLAGSGHTVVRTRYRYERIDQVGVVDLLEGGLPASAGRPLDVEDLTHGPVPSFSVVALNAEHDQRSVYYGAFLRDARVGFISARDMGAYFRFIEAVYVPLGSRQLEKYLYDGLAVLAGAYPKIQVLGAAELFAGKRAERGRLIAACWLLRSAFLAIPFYVAVALARMLASWTAVRTRARPTRVPA